LPKLIVLPAKKASSSLLSSLLALLIALSLFYILLFDCFTLG